MASTRIALAALVVLALHATVQAAEAPAAAQAGGAAGRKAPAAAPSAAAAEPAGLTAKSSLEATGVFVRTGEQSASFAGALRGTFALTGASGPIASLDGADVLCNGIFEVDLSNQWQEGEGRCAFTAKGGDQVFADWECGGAQASGCAGSIEISGGTGAFQGIDGGGDFALEGGVAPLAAGALGKDVSKAQAGTAEWKKLVLDLP